MPRRKGAAGAVMSRRRELVVALAVIAVLGAGVVYAFGRQSLFAGGTDVRAIFSSANELKKGSAVRIGGLDIGRVTSVAAQTDGRALVVMRLKPGTAKLRSDARMTIRPRLAFEGNFYVDVDEGSPTAPALGDGDTIPVRNTTVPVQLDQVLNVFDRSSRDSLKGLISSLSIGLGGGTGSEPSGAAGLRRVNRALARTLESTGRVSTAARGTRRGDLGRSLDSASRLTEELARDPAALSAVITNFRRVMATLADNDREIGGTLRNADALLTRAPTSLRQLDGALPEVRRLSTALRPALEKLGPTLPPANEAFAQLATFTLPGALPRLADDLRTPLAGLPLLEQQIEFAAKYVGSIGRCVDKQLMPALNSVVPDGKLTTPYPAWLELLHAAANLAGGSSNFDGNGVTFRAGLSSGDLNLRGTLPGLGEVVTSINDDLGGVRPVWLGTAKTPEKRPDQVCDQQQPVSLESATGKAFAGFKRERTTPAQADAGLEGLQKLRDALSPKTAAAKPGAATATRTRSTSGDAPSATPDAGGAGETTTTTPAAAADGAAAPAQAPATPGPVGRIVERLGDLLGATTKGATR